MFTSISKKGYEGKGFDVNHLDKNIIALGGIHIHNIKKAHSLGYKGVAVLGSIWQTPIPITNFKEIFIYNNLKTI